MESWKEKKQTVGCPQTRSIQTRRETIQYQNDNSLMRNGSNTTTNEGKGVKRNRNKG